MSTLTIELPESLKKSIEALAAKEGYSVSQFLASAAGEKLAVVLTLDYLRREAHADETAETGKTGDASGAGETWGLTCQVDLAASAAAAKPVFQIRGVSR